MTALVRAELRARRKVIAGLAFGASSLLAIFAASYSAIGTSMLGRPGQAPKYLAAFSGSTSADLTSPRGWMGFGFNHPMFLILALSVAITIGSASIAGEVESGRAELLFVRPRSRRAFLLASLVVWLLAELAVLTVATTVAMGTADLSSTLRAGGMSALAFASVQLLPLTALVAGIAFLASAMSATRGRATAVTIAIVVAAYLANFVALLVDGLGWLRWLSPFNYYDPVGAVAAGVDVGHATVLLIAAGVLMAAAGQRLERRDLA